MLKATSAESGVTKTEVLEWVNAQRKELAEDAPIYLGIHLSNLCRDGLLASVRGASCKGKETVYFALEGGAEQVAMGEEVWPRSKQRGGQREGGRVTPRSVGRPATAMAWDGGREKLQRQNALLLLSAVCKGRRARFVLDNWRRSVTLPPSEHLSTPPESSPTLHSRTLLHPTYQP